MDYKIPPQTCIGHVHLKVSNIENALRFYRDILGFEIMQWYGDSAVFLSAGGYHHHIGLNTWHSKNAPPAARDGVGLYHTAIVYPTRKDLAVILAIKQGKLSTYRSFRSWRVGGLISQRS